MCSVLRHAAKWFMPQSSLAATIPLRNNSRVWLVMTFESRPWGVTKVCSWFSACGLLMGNKPQPGFRHHHKPYSSCFPVLGSNTTRRGVEWEFFSSVHHHNMGTEGTPTKIRLEALITDWNNTKDRVTLTCWGTCRANWISPFPSACLNLHIVRSCAISNQVDRKELIHCVTI